MSRYIVTVIVFTMSMVFGTFGYAELSTQLLVPISSSYDQQLGLLGTMYGVDPTYPELDMYGTYTETSFQWNLSETYLGMNFSLETSGTYDPIADKVTWTSTGLYGSHTWSGNGDITYDSLYSYSGAHEVYIDDVLVNYTVGRDVGTISYPASRYVHHTSCDWFFFIPYPTRDAMDAYDDNGNLKNSYIVEHGSTTIGIGTITIGGISYKKIITPEPSTFVLIALGGLAIIGFTMNRRRKNKKIVGVL
jgi:hypothetical protein